MSHVDEEGVYFFFFCVLGSCIEEVSFTRFSFICDCVCMATLDVDGYMSCYSKPLARWNPCYGKWRIYCISYFDFGILSNDQ